MFNLAGLDTYKAAWMQSDKRFLSSPICLKSLFTVAKAAAPLVLISDYRPQTKGETTRPCFCSLVCSYCPVCKKIKIQSLRYIHHLTFLARVGSVRWVCGDLEEFFWSSANSILKRHQEKVPLIFSSLLASPKFLYREPAGGPPCRCCFNSATQNGMGQNRLLQWKWGRGTSPNKVHSNFLSGFLEMFSE